MLPVLPLMAVWLVMPDFLRGLGIPPQPLQVASAIAAQLLWFLAVYVLVVLLTPLMVAAHRRWGLKVPLVMGVAGVLVDVARFNDLGYIGYANAIFVWVAVPSARLPLRRRPPRLAHPPRRADAVGRRLRHHRDDGRRSARTRPA